MGPPSKDSKGTPGPSGLLPGVDPRWGFQTPKTVQHQARPCFFGSP